MERAGINLNTHGAVCKHADKIHLALFICVSAIHPHRFFTTVRTRIKWSVQQSPEQASIFCMEQLIVIVSSGQNGAGSSAGIQ